MGIINVTLDSFSDGGEYADPAAAIAHGVQLAAEGASVIDIGGESSRPGAIPVDELTELERVIRTGASNDDATPEQLAAKMFG